MAVIKEQVRAGLDSDRAAALAEADVLIGESFTRPDKQEGVDSYLERRAPAFPPLLAAGIGA